MYFVKGKNSLLSGFGLIFLGGNGILLVHVFHRILLDLVLNLTPNGILFGFWQEPLPLTFKIHYFNWTNPDQMHDRTVKPKFQQMGPYLFKEVMEKVNMTWHDNNNTLTYKMVKKYEFERDKSTGPLSDKVTTVQPLFTGLSYIARHWNYVLKKGISITMSKLAQNVYFQKTVGELTFEGFEDTLFEIAQKTSFLVGITLPDIDRFGYFSGRNLSSHFEKAHTIATGLGDKYMGELLHFKDSKNPKFFPEKCGNIRGFVDIFPALDRGLNDSINFFMSDFCRDFTLYFDKKVSVDGLDGYKFIANEKTFDNGTKIPESKCYCPGECQPSGAVNISTCILGFPMFISQPHFRQADPYYLNNVEGLQPNDLAHETYLIIDALSGIPLEFVGRFQFNVLLQPDDTVSLFYDVPHLYVPVLWVEQRILTSPQIKTCLKLLQLFPVITYTAFSIAFAVGVLMVTSVVMQTGLLHFKTIFRRKRIKREKCPEMVPLTQKEFYGARPRKFIRTNTCAF